MAVDPTNAVVRLLGDAASREGAEPEAAAAAYRRAWEIATDDYERCMAAHYVARSQDTLEDRYRWNALAVEKALAVDEERIRNFLPSLYLNLGRSLEDMARLDEAREAYDRAAAAAADMPEGPYRSTIEGALRRACLRVSSGLP